MARTCGSPGPQKGLQPFSQSSLSVSQASLSRNLFTTGQLGRP